MTMLSAMYSTDSQNPDDDQKEKIDVMLRRLHRENVGLIITACALFGLGIAKTIALFREERKK